MEVLSREDLTSCHQDYLSLLNLIVLHPCYVSGFKEKDVEGILHLLKPKLISPAGENSNQLLHARAFSHLIVNVSVLTIR